MCGTIRGNNWNAIKILIGIGNIDLSNYILRLILEFTFFFSNILYKLTFLPSSLFSVTDISSSWSISWSSLGYLGGLILYFLRLGVVGVIRVLEDAYFCSTFSSVLVVTTGFFTDLRGIIDFIVMFWNLHITYSIFFIYLLQLLVCARFAISFLVGYFLYAAPGPNKKRFGTEQFARRNRTSTNECLTYYLFKQQPRVNDYSQIWAISSYRAGLEPLNMHIPQHIIVWIGVHLFYLFFSST